MHNPRTHIRPRQAHRDPIIRLQERQAQRHGVENRRLLVQMREIVGWELPVSRNGFVDVFFRQGG